MRQRIRYKHYSLRTEKAYLFWVRRYIRFHRLRHPRVMGASEIEAWLTHLATVLKVSASTHKQALAAALFLYREVLCIDLPWMGEIGRPKTPLHLPVVLSREEVAALLAHIPPEHWLICALLYGAGLRLEECLSLRIKDVDFARRIIYVRHGKGSKDRIVMLPAPAAKAIHAQVEASRLYWTQDRASCVPGVEVPHALARKLGRAAESFTWHWLFPNIRRPCLVRCAMPPAGRGSRSVSPPTRCATPSPRTCWIRASTSVVCRSCWAIPTSVPQ